MIKTFTKIVPLTGRYLGVYVVVDRDITNYDQQGAWLYMDRYIGETCVMDENHIQFKEDDGGVHTLYAAAKDYQSLNKIVATIGFRIKGVPYIKLPEVEESFEKKVVTIIKNALVKGQQFELAGIFRDEQRRIDIKEARVPIIVELEYDGVCSNYEYNHCAEVASYGTENECNFCNKKLKTDSNNIITPVNVFYE